LLEVRGNAEVEAESIKNVIVKLGSQRIVEMVSVDHRLDLRFGSVWPRPNKSGVWSHNVS